MDPSVPQAWFQIDSLPWDITAKFCGTAKLPTLLVQRNAGLVIAVSEIVCHSPNTTTCHHHFGDDSRRRLGLAAQKKHTTRKYNISSRVPGSTDGILAHFFERMKNKKCAQITSVLPGTLEDMLYLRVVCFFCAVSPRRRRESLPSQWWQVVAFGLWQAISETAIVPSTIAECRTN